MPTRPLLLWVLPAVLVTGVVTIVTSARSLPALLAVLGLALVEAELVNIWVGDTQGPVARSVALAAAPTALAVSAALSTRPWLAFGPLTGVVIGSLVLGAGGEVRGPAAASTAVAALGVAMAARRHGEPVPWLRGTIAALLVALAAGSAAVLQGERSDRPPRDLLPGSVLGAPITPSFPDLLPGRAPTRGLPASDRAQDPPRTSHHPSARVLRTPALLLVGVGIGALLLAALRRHWQWWAWKRRLRRTRGTEGVAGAWTWALARLQRLGRALPSSMGPESVGHELPDGSVLAVPLRALGDLVAEAAFDGEPVGDRDQLAWKHAERVVAAARSEAPAARRLLSQVAPPRRR